MSIIAWEWLHNQESIWWRYVLPIVSIIYWIVGLQYDLSPWLPTQGGWGGQQLPAFFYTFFLVFILFKLTPKCGKIVRQAFVWAGTYSYYIFLIQMVFFKLLPMGRFEVICGKILIVNSSVMLVAYVLCAMIGSVFPVFLYDKIKTIRSNKIQVVKQ